MFNQLKWADPGGVGGGKESSTLSCIGGGVTYKGEVGGGLKLSHIIINTRQSMTNQSDHYFFLT